MLNKQLGLFSKKWSEIYLLVMNTAQKKKFSVKDFSRKCDQIRSFLRIWSDLLKKSLMVNLIFLCSRSKMKDIKEDSK